MFSIDTVKERLARLKYEISQEFGINKPEPTEEEKKNNNS
jgi:hypothetical protein